ncbi:TipAS antibiotic-recognition domain-containing protein [Paenibacillus sp. F411]|uniref:MerR family transcriptional regulator n=1 Tax=Paenibacillus sp. F411 TaxID=2820239 RepID=UPI001AAF3BD9|nr:TipAS antibiotic-recognition domain-containing protein [Paenibacillus sp. F411]MBO2945313.1 TipAS antibiotic-recognition domain-containing protein [Paenibacillus sp. F411]
MAYNLQDIARVSGVGAPRLQEWIRQGLLQLSPDEEGSTRFEEQDLLRLQLILLNMELHIPASQLKLTLDEQEQDIIAALLAHKQSLMDKVRRLQMMTETIDRTLSDLEKGAGPNPETWLAGLGGQGAPESGYLSNDSLHIEEGPSQEGREEDSRWSKDDYLSTQKEADEIYLDLCRAMDSGLKPEHPEVQSIIDRHYRWVGHFYTPSKKIYIDLGELYVEQDDFKKLYDVYHPRLAHYLRDAMKVYAEARL